jgi:hypothetical protein
MGFGVPVGRKRKELRLAITDLQPSTMNDSFHQCPHAFVQCNRPWGIVNPRDSRPRATARRRAGSFKTRQDVQCTETAPEYQIDLEVSAVARLRTLRCVGAGVGGTSLERR